MRTCVAKGNECNARRAGGKPIEMTLLSVAERARVWRLLAHTAWQSILRWVHGGPLFRWRPFAGAPARLLIAPQDLRTADGTNAADIYAGRFVFAGQQIEANGRSPFEVEPPPGIQA